jgi:predicted Zn-dependent protease
LRAILRAADLLPDSAYMMATVGYGYINLNRIPEAIPPLQRAAHFAPNDFLVQAQLGFCLQATGQTEAGIDHLRKGLS